MYEAKLKLAEKNLRENQEQREADLSSIEKINQELQQIKTQLAQLASQLS
jgi:capsule polysaccharide export protein KpsE/RkpR